MDRGAVLVPLLILIWSSIAAAQSEGEAPAYIVAAARRALPHLADAQDWSYTLIRDVKTTALGCHPMKGLQLPQAIEVYSLRLMDRGAQALLHVSADGSMTQLCGDGTETGLVYPSISSERDGDGDGFADSADACPGIAGLPGADRPGCPQASRGDRDGDGLANSDDACPRQAGSAAADGCSLYMDEDGDGVPDSEDICPQDFGVIRGDFALGCPADGSGNSSRWRGTSDVCAFEGFSVPLYEGPSLATAVIGTIDALGDGSAEIIGRDGTGFWYQAQGGWIPESAVELRGACYNIPLVNMTAGAGTGCYLRAVESAANVRRAPRDKQVSRISPGQSYAVLGQNLSGDWLFFRQGWVRRSLLELAGDCARLPVLDPGKVSSGVVHFCPPLYEGFLPPRIDVGPAGARVASWSLANRLRATPELGAEQIGEILPRQAVDAVLDGPACEGAFVWWQVEVNGLIGWTVESDLNANVYYLEPAPAPADPEAGAALQPARDGSSEGSAATMISSANLQGLGAAHVLMADEPIQAAWSPDNQTLALLAADGGLQLYRYPGFDVLPVNLYLPAEFQASAIAFGMDDNLAIGGRDGSVVFVVGLDEGASGLVAPALSAAVSALAWSDDGNFLAAASGDPPSKLAGRDGELVVWEVAERGTVAKAVFHFAFPYALTDIAFSANGRWLAVMGENPASRRAALWVYDARAGGRLAFSKALIGGGALGASPDADLADFFYSNGDSLYLVDIDSGRDLRFYHRAGALLPQLDIRRRVVGGAEILLAIGNQDADGQTWLHFVNAMNDHSPALRLSMALDDLAFSPDGRAIAVAQRAQNRVLILAAGAR